MRIFVAAHSSRYGGGITVARNLIAALGRGYPQHEYLFTISPGLDYERSCGVAPRNEMIIYKQKNLAERWIWETYKLPAMVHDFRPDVIFNMANRGFVNIAVPQAILIQDPHLFYSSSQYGNALCRERFKFWYHRNHFKMALKYTQLLFCQTEVAAARVKDSYSLQAKIAICPNLVSVEDQAQPPIVPEPLRRIEAKTKLFVLSRYYSHKNLEIIPELFRNHADKLNDVAFILTISPDQHPNAARLLKKIEKSGLAQNIISVGQIPQADLPGYYRHTDALFLPTLMESFSGTYLEALYFRRPIMTSDLDFARLVCGDAAIYFNPRNAADICQRILEFKENDGLKKTLEDRGQPRRREILSISWDDLGKGVMRELEGLVSAYAPGGIDKPLDVLH